MINHVELFRALLNGDILVNDDDDTMSIVNGNVEGVDKHGVKFPIKWIDPDVWVNISQPPVL